MIYACPDLEGIMIDDNELHAWLDSEKGQPRMADYEDEPEPWIDEDKHDPTGWEGMQESTDVHGVPLDRLWYTRHLWYALCVGAIWGSFVASLVWWALS